MDLDSMYRERLPSSPTPPVTREYNKKGLSLHRPSSELHRLVVVCDLTNFLSISISFCSSIFYQYLVCAGTEMLLY